MTPADTLASLFEYIQDMTDVCMYIRVYTCLSNGRPEVILGSLHKVFLFLTPVPLSRSPSLSSLPSSGRHLLLFELQLPAPSLQYLLSPCLSLKHLVIKPEEKERELGGDAPHQALLLVLLVYKVRVFCCCCCYCCCCCCWFCSCCCYCLLTAVMLDFSLGCMVERESESSRRVMSPEREPHATILPVL